MMKKLISVCLMASALFLSNLFTSCKKQDLAPSTNAKCKVITSIIQGITYTFSYDADGKILTRKGADGKLFFQYADNKVYITRKYVATDVTESTTTLTLNANNMVSEQNILYYGGSRRKFVYQYSGTELIKITNTTSNSSSEPKITILEWANGNFVKFIHLDNPKIFPQFNYDSNIKSQTGDYTWLFNFYHTYGFTIFKTRNIITSIFEYDKLRELAHEFGEGGVVKMDVVVVGATFNFSQLQYQCKN